MALAAVGFAKAMQRRQIMMALSSIGPGSTNFVTAAGRPWPIGCRSCSSRATPSPNRRPRAAAGRALRRPDGHGERRLQAGHPLLGPDHPPRADRLVAAAGGGDDARSRRLRPGLHRALPGHPGRGLRLSRRSSSNRGPLHPPSAARTAARSRRPRRSQKAKPPLLIAGGGVHYSLADRRSPSSPRSIASRSSRPSPGKASLLHEPSEQRRPDRGDRLGLGQRAGGRADVIVAVGTRLQDFTTGSWTVFEDPDAPLIAHQRRPASTPPSIARCRSSATRARRSPSSTRRSATGRRTKAWMTRADAGIRDLERHGRRRRPADQHDVPTYAQVVGAINRVADATTCADRGRRPARRAGQGLAVKSVGTFDSEFGYSTMGYEIAGGWGAKMAEASATSSSWSATAPT